MKKFIIGLLLFPGALCAEGNMFVEADHYSQLTDVDWGLTMLNIGVEYELNDSLSVVGKLGTPIGQNDMGRFDRYWDNGDAVAGLTIKWKFWSF